MTNSHRKWAIPEQVQGKSTQVSIWRDSTEAQDTAESLIVLSKGTTRPALAPTSSQAQLDMGPGEQALEAAGVSLDTAKMAKLQDQASRQSQRMNQ